MKEDLSDEAFWAWYDVQWPGDGICHVHVWQECRRRAEARIKELEDNIESLNASIDAMIHG